MRLHGDIFSMLMRPSTEEGGGGGKGKKGRPGKGKARGGLLSPGMATIKPGKGPGGKKRRPPGPAVPPRGRKARKGAPSKPKSKAGRRIVRTKK